MGIFKNKRGSTLILLVYIISIIVLLGTTILTTTVLNYKMNISNSKYVKNSYLSDAGIDEAYAIALLTYNTTYTNTQNYIIDLSEKINVDIIKIVAGSMTYNQSIYNDFITMDNNMDKIKLDHEFTRYFSNKFNNVYTTEINNFKSKIDDSIKLKLEETKSKNNKSYFTITSSYKNYSITRKNQMEIVVTLPLVESVFIESENLNNSIKYNPLLSKPLFIQEDFHFNGDSIIDGDIIVLGNMVDKGVDSKVELTGNLSVYGNDIAMSNLNGSIRLNTSGNLRGINNLYTNTVKNGSSLYSYSGVSIPGISANNIYLNDKMTEIEKETLGIGVSAVNEEFTSLMKNLLLNINGDVKNTIKNGKLDLEKAQPVQLLYNIAKGNNLGNENNDNRYFVSSDNDIYYLFTSNENNKDIYVFGPPYYYDNSNNNDKNIDSLGEYLNIKNKNIDNKNKLIYDDSLNKNNYTSGTSLKLNTIIVSTGDVYIYGNIDFTGSVICFGNLFIEGEGIKKIRNNLQTNLAEELFNSGNKFNEAFNGFDDYLTLSNTMETIDDINQINIDSDTVSKQNWRMLYGE